MSIRLNPKLRKKDAKNARGKKDISPEDKAEEERGSVVWTEEEAREIEAEEGTGWGGRNKRSTEELAEVAATAAEGKGSGKGGSMSNPVVWIYEFICPTDMAYFCTSYFIHIT